MATTIAPPDPPHPVQYKPAPHLLTGPGAFLSAEELAFYFQDFYASLEHVESTPQFVFERLVANLGGPVQLAIQMGGNRTAVNLDTEKEVLRVRVAKLEAEIGLLRSKMAALEPEPAAAISNPTIGTFHTDEGAWDSQKQKCSKLVTTTVSPARSVQALGLTSFHIANTNMLIVTSAIKSRDAGFEISITSSTDDVQGYESGIKQASCSWLEIDPQDKDFQFGAFNLIEDHPWNNMKAETLRQIVFEREYPVPPQVVAWVNRFALEISHDRRFHTYADNITSTGFTLHTNSSATEYLYAAGISWVAYPTSRASTYSGTICTPEVNTASAPGSHTGYVAFESGIFTAPPRVMVAINRFQSSKSEDLHLAVRISNITKDGMTWIFTGKGDTKICRAGASFIALG